MNTKHTMTSTTEFIRKVQAIKRRRDAVLGSTEKARKSMVSREQFVPVHRVKAKAKAIH